MSTLPSIPEDTPPLLHEQETSFNQLYADNVAMQQDLQGAINRYNCARIFLAHTGVDLEIPEWVNGMQPLLNSLQSQAEQYKSTVDTAITDARDCSTSNTDAPANQNRENTEEEHAFGNSRTIEDLVALLIEITARIADHNRSLRRLLERLQKTTQIFTRDAERQRGASQRKIRLAAKRAEIAQSSSAAWKRIEKMIAEKEEATRAAAEKLTSVDKALMEKRAEKEKEVEERRAQLKKDALEKSEFKPAQKEEGPEDFEEGSGEEELNHGSQVEDTF
ncbi:hypothetical protein F5884DRAFT_791478 [Xylogone sp. PMI_703]|nr:hypothetical protein F5884DRAFT_791478 [Xylogone sp. PMI_703]